MKILIVYGTTEGQTRKISHFMEATLKDVGYEVTVADASETPPSPSAYDAVIIGASIHIHKYQSAVVHYICLLYTSDAADERSSVDLGGRRIIKKKTLPA